MNTKRTSKRVGSLASKILRNKKSSITAKALAGGALSQTRTSKQTGKENETLASMVLKSTKYSKETKILAATLVAQSNKLK